MTLDRVAVRMSGLHGTATYPPGSRLAVRRLRDYEFVWILEGDVVWHRPGEDRSVRPGTILLATPASADGYTWDPHHRTRHAYFHFTLHDPDHQVVPADLPDARTDPDAILRPLFRHVVGLLADNEPTSRSLAEDLARSLLAVFAGPVRAPTARPPLPPPVARALAHVASKWESGRLEPVSMAELARHADVSPAHLSRQFAARFGQPPIRALRLLRMGRAADLLAGTDLAVTELADLCGFADPFHFSRPFTNVVGTAPTHWRDDPDSVPPDRSAELAQLVGLDPIEPP